MRLGVVQTNFQHRSKTSSGLPNLRVVTPVVFDDGNVSVPLCGDDPVPLARRLLREKTGCEEMFSPEVSWALRHTPDRKEIVPMPGWRSAVRSRPCRPKPMPPLMGLESLGRGATTKMPRHWSGGRSGNCHPATAVSMCCMTYSSKDS